MSTPSYSISKSPFLNRVRRTIQLKHISRRTEKAIFNYIIDYIRFHNKQHAYSRQTVVYPSEWIKEYKFWSAVGRIDNAYDVHRRCGYAVLRSRAFSDRNLVCSCVGMENYK